MDINTRLQEAHARIRGSFTIVTNVITPEGSSQVAVGWKHAERNCLVLGDDLDTAMRKAILLEDDLIEQDKRSVCD